jgi:hypothetical protein
MGWWRELLVGWVLIFILPKLVIVPIFGGMWRAMKKTDEQDRIDAIWLAEYEAQRGNGGGGGNDPVPAYRKRRPPRSPRNSGDRRPGGRKTRATP